MFRLTDNTWFVGTTHGLSKWNAQTDHMEPVIEVPNDAITFLEADPSGRLWIGTFGSGVFRTDGTHYESLDEDRGLSDNIALTAHFDDRGIAWVGTSAGL